MLLIFVLCSFILVLRAQEVVRRPAGPMKTWSKKDFDTYIRQLEGRKHLYKSAAHGDRKFGLHDGNKMRTLFYNYGSIGRPNTEPSMEWPAYSGHGYAYEFGAIVGAQVVDAYGDTVGIFSDGMLDGGDYDPTGGANWWGWEPLPGYAAVSPNENIAASNNPMTWGYNFPTDEEGNLLWPGQFGDGIVTADLESYFVMDDRFNAEFEYYPSPSDSSLRGTGVEVEVRGYQYAASVAEDIIFFQYNVTNASEKRLEKVVLGMIGDPHIGGAGDFSDDFAAFINSDGTDGFTGEVLDVNDMVYCWDKEGSGNDYAIPWDDLGWMGYKFLESPGIVDDGVDNDNDGMVDESQYDNFDNDGDWQSSDEEATADTAEAREWWDEKMWNGIDDDGDGRVDDWGDLDGKSDDLNGNGVPDADEPDFELTDVDESDMLGLTSFWAPIYGTEEAGMDDKMWKRMIPGTFATGGDIAQDADNIFIFGTGYFSLDPGESQKFSIAVIMGQNKDDLLSNAKVADWIYKLGFQFTKPPDKPTVVAVPSDGQVTLYWDDIAEQSVDPVNGEDFEGYKIYRSTVKGQWGKELTDNQGISVGYMPIAQFDLDDDIEGTHEVASAEGYHMDMGDDTGIRRTFIDSNLVNGLTYYYAVTAYDQGSVEGNIPPLECSKNLGDVNVMEATPNAPAAGYEAAGVTVEHYEGFGSGTVTANLIDFVNMDASIGYDLGISQSGSKSYVTVTEVAGEDSTVIWDSVPVEEVEANGLSIGVSELFVLDVGVALDSAKWITGTEYFDFEIIGGSVTYPRDLEIRFFDDHADSSIISALPMRFQVWNVNENQQMDVYYLDKDGDDQVSIGDEIQPVIYQGGTPKAVWKITPAMPSDSLLAGTPPPEGSTISIWVSKPFGSEGVDDRYRIGMTSASVDESKVSTEMEMIAVVPNPYVAASTFETPPPQVFSAGRGERRIDFIHLPQECTIRIFTLAGDHVRTIDHSGTIFDGTESWNLLNKDDHDIAPGVYIYHVETPDGYEKVGRIGVIK